MNKDDLYESCFDDFTKAYLECMARIRSEEESFTIPFAWSDEFEQIERDCRVFKTMAYIELIGLCPSQCGHDFYLTRNGHGSGFWDRGYPSDISQKLTYISEEMGPSTE